MSFTELQLLQSPTSECKNLFAAHPLEEFILLPEDKHLDLTQSISVPDEPEHNIGYEVTVLTTLECKNNYMYEPISDDESRDSVSSSSVYTTFPKYLEDWNSTHIMKWILELYERAGYRYEDLSLYHLNKTDGKFLMDITEAYCEKIDKKRSKWLYEQIQDLIHTLTNKNINSCSDSGISSISLSTQRDSFTSDEEIERIPLKRKRGRPPKLGAKRRPEAKIGRVWEFLRNLLFDPKTCPSLIYWEDYSTKKFRLRDGKKVAELWGKKKNNPNMTYEKFSRTIRHYYKDEVIISVPKEKLVYRFGVNAKGVETSNPNFGHNNL